MTDRADDILTLCNIRREDPELKIIEKINEEAFPSSERLSTEQMFAFVERTDASVFGIYHRKELAGFAMTVQNAECVYIFFLAIRREFRRQGLGKLAVEALFQEFSGRQVILDFEELDPLSENYPQRVRRKAFYLRCGFHETGRYTMLRGERFEVVCSGEKLDEYSFLALIKTIHSFLPEFPELLI